MGPFIKLSTVHTREVFNKGVIHTKNVLKSAGHLSATAESAIATENYVVAIIASTNELIRGMNEVIERLERLERMEAKRLQSSGLSTTLR